MRGKVGREAKNGFQKPEKAGIVPRNLGKKEALFGVLKRFEALFLE